jgi:N6-adenosine-specific RNA methylase IME4
MLFRGRNDLGEFQGTIYPDNREVESELTENALANIEKAGLLIASAKTIDEALDLKEKLAVAEFYARQKGIIELEEKAREYKLWAERRIGQLIIAGKQEGKFEDRGGDRKSISANKENDLKVKLEELPFDKNERAYFQKLAKIPEKEFPEFAVKTARKIKNVTKHVANIIIQEELGKKERKITHLPKGEFNVIYADPPWRYEFTESVDREIENQYPTLDLEEIKSIKIPSAKDSILFLWSPAPKLEEAIQVVNSWGFNYRTCAVWMKEQIGMGHYFRLQHELLLIAIKGSPGTPTEKDRIPSIIKSPRTKHSEKPKIFYDIIERMYPDSNRLELFAREKRKDWTSWGNEIE